MKDIYDQLKVRKWINANGYLTRLGGCVMPDEVIDAMRQAAQSFVSIEELQAAASMAISRHTGAQAGIVTSGAAAALTLGTAACMTGLDADKMNRLPDTQGMSNEVAMHRSHRWGYDHAIRAAGARIVEFGMVDYLSSYGVRSGMEEAEAEAAISPGTAAFAFMATPHNCGDLKTIVAVARRHDLPVIVDAAPWLPPVQNLRTYMDLGASLVAYSGGKALRGPQSSGILCGDKRLIAAAALQQFDMNVNIDTWNPPQSLIPRQEMKGVPNHGIGRGSKVSKEEIIGLLTALELFVSRDHDAELRQMQHILEEINGSLSVMSGIQTKFVDTENTGRRPLLEISIDTAIVGRSAIEISRCLKESQCPIQMNERLVRQGTLIVDPACLSTSDVQIVVTRLAQIISGESRTLAAVRK